MSPESVVTEVQTDAARTAVSDVESAILAGDSVIVSEIAAVDQHLAEHAEVSEERHEEILEGQAWLENQFQSVQSTLTALQTTLTAMLTTLTGQNQACLSILETLNQNLSTVSSPSTPPPPEAVVVEPPESAVVDHQAALMPRVKRRLI
jgi:hypothetical protein